MAEDDWKRAWDPVVAAVGQETGTLASRGGRQPDAIERGAIRKYLETLEFDCALHTDPDVARAHGFADVTAPYTATISFTLPPMWVPGEVLFTTDEPDAQPEKSAVKPALPDFFPPITGYFANDMEFEYIRPATVGERVYTQGGKLVSCEPKETSVGRGAFLKTETRLVNQDGDLIARMLTGMFYYNPHPQGAA